MVAKPDRAIGPPTLPDQIRRPRSFSSWRRVDSSGTSDLHQTARTIRRRTPRLRSDQTAIAARSSRDRGYFITESSPRSSNGTQWRIKITIVARSRLDRGPITARSWPDRGPIVGLFEAKFKLIRRGFEATKPCDRNRLHDT